jgi:hypothetical protein
VCVFHLKEVFIFLSFFFQQQPKIREETDKQRVSFYFFGAFFSGREGIILLASRSPPLTSLKAMIGLFSVGGNLRGNDELSMQIFNGTKMTLLSLFSSSSYRRNITHTHTLCGFLLLLLPATDSSSHLGKTKEKL